MPKLLRHDPRSQELSRDGTLNSNPDGIRDPLFASNRFFDPKDLLQVRYEMVRRHHAEGMSVSDAAALYGVTRQTFYNTQRVLATSGLAGLLPRPRGPKDGHKLSSNVVAFVTDLKKKQPESTKSQCLAAIEKRYGITVSRRGLESALARTKNREANLITAVNPVAWTPDSL